MARVIVVGAGVVGLSCAVRLLEVGHRVDVVARDLPLETTSAVAAALWYPYRAYPVERVAGWSRTTYGELERLAGDERTGVRMLPGTELLPERTSDPWWRDAVPALSRVSPPAPYLDGWSFVAPVIEMPVYLAWLTARLEELGGTLTRMALSALPDRADVVVNASGLGARRLAGDPSPHPVRGQVVLVEQLGLDRWWLDGSGPMYVVPRSADIVVGGTDDEGEWDRRPDSQVAERLLARAAEVVPELARRPRRRAPGGPAPGTSGGAAGGRRHGGHPGRALLRPRRSRCDAVVGLRRRGRGPGRCGVSRARPLVLALPGLALFVLGQFHPQHLTYATSHAWWVLHVVGLFLFPLVSLALVALVRGRRDPAAVLVVLLAYGFATAYSALDVVSGIAAGYVTERLGPGRPRPPEVGSLFHIGNQIGYWGALALVLAALVVVADSLWRHRLQALPAVLMLPGAHLVQTHHIYHPLGAAGMALIGLSTGWLAYAGAPGRQNSRSDGSSIPRSAS